jgi:uncharacterized protein (TIGR03790 family)
VSARAAPFPSLLACLALALLAANPALAETTAQVKTEAVNHSIRVPRIAGRLTAANLGLVINTDDPYSVAVGAYYAKARGIPEQQIVRLSLPLRNTLKAAELEALASQIRSNLPANVQALALAWARPYAVECNAITAALTLGFQPELCKQTCAASTPSPLFNNNTLQPFTDMGLRPSMLLAASSIDAAKALIERGIASDQQLGKRGVPEVQAVFASTPDAARNVRAALYPPGGQFKGLGMQVLQTPVPQTQASQAADPAPALQRVVLYQTGAVRVNAPETIPWVPGALADHLTSFGGQLFEAHGQMTVLDWIDAGATASHGTVSEPCNHLQKFPHPQVLLLNYLQGSSAIEAYWRSLAWPAQGLLVGEPLAAPFGH